MSMTGLMRAIGGGGGTIIRDLAPLVRAVGKVGKVAIAVGVAGGVVSGIVSGVDAVTRVVSTRCACGCPGCKASPTPEHCDSVACFASG